MKKQPDKIREFLSSISDLEFRYLRVQISMANDARYLIKEFNLGKEMFCRLMQIKESEYDQYLTGGFDYDLMKMALMNAAYCELSSEKAESECKGKFTDIIAQ
jgi:hypothetical protein